MTMHDLAQPAAPRARTAGGDPRPAGPATSRLRRHSGPRTVSPERIAQQNARASARRQRVREPHLPGVVTGVGLVGGVWLTIAPAVLGYSSAADAARWNDLIVGVVLIVLAAIRLTRFARVLPTTLVTVGVGVWLIAAPFALEYGFAPRSALISLNDMVVGALLAFLALLAHASGRLGANSRL